ncbi:MAG TPA: TonB-dependent receptor [Methylibium sp.]|uniref:TonB-dependent receptor domain-containing protein n=1 Tax=Methylibium sp. TaxID=2067992 RepID=UPI002DBCAD77|nr:TonB-dependent receptor [Methylibium sp.]HEU4459888.1 TonB-dependent receptor [Methylibium sp.]
MFSIVLAPRGAPSARALLRAALLVGAAAIALPSFAQPVASAALPGVVVTATRTPNRIDATLAETTVIERAEIERATGRTLPELLARQPGLQSIANGGLGKSSSVSVRGLEGRHTLLLIDGVRYGSATLGTPSWDNIPLDTIERIEIVRGPLSSLYGSDAVGGVVQIFTRRGAEGLRANASATAGSRSYRQAAGGLRAGAGAFDAAVQASHTRTDGFSATNDRAAFGFNPDDDGFRQNTASLQLGWAIGGGWRADARALESKGRSRYDDGPGADTQAGLATSLQSLALAGPVRADWRTALRLSRAIDDGETLVSSSASSLGSIRSDQRQLSWENTLATRAGTVLLLAERIEQRVSKPGVQYDVTDRSIDALAAGLDGNAGAHHWQVSLRRDRNSQFGDPTTGALAYGLDFTLQVRAAFSLGTSFVAPSFNQLYFPGFGNPLLQPEEGRHKELSLRFAESGHELRAAWFRHDIEGFITPGPRPSNTDARIAGFGLGYEGRVDRWQLAASAERIDPRNDSPSNANFGRQLPRRAKSSFKASADADFGAWQLGAVLAAFGPRFDNLANTIPLGGYATLDLRADWRFARAWTLGLKLNNAADKRYETAYGFNQPRREAYVTLRYSGL